MRGLWQGHARLTGPRVRATSAPAFARPRTPALAEILARDPTMANLVATINGADRGGHRRRGMKLLSELVECRERTALHVPDWAVVARMMWGRAATATPASLTAYLSGMRAVATRVGSPMAPAIDHPLVADYLQALRIAAGPPALIRGATPATFEDVLRVVERAPRQVAQVVALAWLRAARIADVLELRVGGLWRSGNMLAMEQPPTKHLLARGCPRVVLMDYPEWAEGVLRDLVSTTAPTTAALARPPMFSLTREKIVTAIRRADPTRSLTAHSFRKGAIAALARAGASVHDMTALSGHRTREALCSYLGHVPKEVERSMRRCGTLLGGRTRTPTRSPSTSWKCSEVTRAGRERAYSR